MAEDDLNEAPKEAAGEAVTDKDTPPVKKKAVRKKTPQSKTAAKKKVSIKKKAAPKKKAARKSNIAASMEKDANSSSPATVPQTPQPVAVSGQETPPKEMADTANPDSDSVTEASATANTTDQIPDKTAEIAAETAVAAPGSGDKSPKETPPRNENVQKRLEEMGLMPSDSAEKQTPPPGKKSASGLGFWQKSFIWAIVIVAGLLYLRTLTNDGDGVGDETAVRDAEINKTEQVATTDASSTDVTQTGNPVTATDQPDTKDLAMVEAAKDDSDSVPANQTSSDNASASVPSTTTMETADAEVQENKPTEVAAPISATDLAEGDQQAATTTVETADAEVQDNKPTEVAAPISATDLAEGDQQAATTTAPTPAPVSQPADDETGQISVGEGSEQQPVATPESTGSDTSPQAEETAVVAENNDTLSGSADSASQAAPTNVTGPAGSESQAAPTSVTGPADSESQAAPTNVTGPAGSESQAAPTGVAGPADSESQTAPTGVAGPAENQQRSPRMASGYSRPGVAQMWTNPPRSMPNRFGTTQSPAPTATTPGIEQDQAGNSANNMRQAPIIMGRRYPLPYQRGFITPGYPWGFNPQATPYYWPYPPRPPVYGPAVRYPYYYPQMPR